MKWLAALITLVLVAGCSGPEGESEYIYVIDRSDSTGGTRQNQIDSVVVELDSVPLGTHLTIYRMGSTTEEVYSDDLNDTGIEALKNTLMNDAKASDPVKGTNFNLMTQAVARRVASSKAKEIHIRLLTDGADDFTGDPKNQAAYEKAAKEVCSDKRVRSIVFAGVKPGFREAIRRNWGNSASPLQISSQ